MFAAWALHPSSQLEKSEISKVHDCLRPVKASLSPIAQMNFNFTEYFFAPAAFPCNWNWNLIWKVFWHGDVLDYFQQNNFFCIKRTQLELPPNVHQYEPVYKVFLSCFHEVVQHRQQAENNKQVPHARFEVTTYIHLNIGSLDISGLK